MGFDPAPARPFDLGHPSMRGVADVLPPRGLQLTWRVTTKRQWGSSHATPIGRSCRGDIAAERSGREGRDGPDVGHSSQGAAARR